MNRLNGRIIVLTALLGLVIGFAAWTRAQTVDTQPPTAPGSLAAVAVSTSRINLSWAASSDNVGVYNYRIERCRGTTCTNFTQIGTATGTAYSNTGLTAGVTYRYRVRAADRAGNFSPYSNIAAATTTDSQAPSAPANLTAAASSTSQISLTWTAATDNFGVYRYRIERCSGTGCTNFAQIATASGTTYSNTGLQDATPYNYRVRASDAAGNLGPYSNVASATTIDAPPSVPSNLSATAGSATQINLSWTASTDRLGVTGYEVERCPGVSCTSFALVATTTGTTYGDSGLTANTTYRYRVRAKDTANNFSSYSSIASATTFASDVTTPTVSSITPASGASAIALDANITVTFSEAMDAASVNNTTFQLRDAGGTLVPSAVTYNATTKTAVIDPTTDLSGSTSYTATVKGGATGVKDVAGNALAADYTWSFSSVTAASVPEPTGWYAGDMHVHRSCGGSPEAVSSIFSKMTSQNLTSISLLADMGNGEVQNPATDLPLVTGGNDPISTATRTVHWDAEWHWDAIYTQYAHQALGGHIVSLGLTEAHQIWEEQTYSILNWAHQQNGISGFVHMQYLDNSIPQNLDCCTPVEYPVEVALASVDFIAEDVNGGDSAIQAYYRLLNTGFRPGFAAGTDYPCGVSELGSLLTYVQVAGGQFTYRNWIEGIKNGRTVVSRNGHNEFINLVVNGTATPGDEIKLTTSGSVPVTITWTAAKSLSGTIELVRNGVVVASWTASAAPGSPATFSTTVNFANSGWLAARRMETSGHRVHTGAVFVLVGNAPIRANADDALFYMQWMDNLLTKTAPGGPWNSYFPTNLAAAQARYQAAKTVFQQIYQQTSGDITPPTVASEVPVAGASGVDVGANITVTFNEAMDAATINSGTVILQDSLGNQIQASVAYNTATRTVSLDPTSQLSYSSIYTVVIVGGTGGVKDAAGNALSSNVNWSFNTGAAPGPGPDEGPGGPILVIASSANPFTRYYAEILRSEGFNAFLVSDISNVSSSVLANYDVAVLGEMTLTDSQVAMLNGWVNSGGHLIAMKPDKRLASLLGLTDAGSSLAEGYLRVDTSTGPGSGIVGETIQYHGTADRYTANGAAVIATLYSNATTATGNPAVTLLNVGSNGGKAAAFTYDLAKSIVYMRQGNPVWAGQERDGLTPIRSDDLFYPGWIDFTKIAIPQADEQQRLFANLITKMNLDKKPLPRFWYLPRGLKAAVVMTSDNHGVSNNVVEMFNRYIASSPAGCSVTDWECIRATAYIFTDGLLSPSQAAAYTSSGFEIALHINTGCADYTPASLESNFSDQLSSWTAMYSNLPAPVTNRTHCVVWSDYSTTPQTELSHGMGLDTTYYFWPDVWVLNRPGFFTGSGMPMRFATSSGSLIDVYQVPTQMTDESEQTYPFTIDSLLDKAIGTEGYYGVFAANMHSDSAQWSISDAIVGSAVARGVPIVSARQMLDWLDGRNGSSFGGLTWDGTTLVFTVSAAQNTNGLTLMVPSPTGTTSSSVWQNDMSIPFSTSVIKGTQYVVFRAISGTYRVVFAADTTPPTIMSVTPSNGASGVDANANVTATFSEAMDASTITASTFALLDPSRNIVPAVITYDAAAKTATLNPSAALTVSTTYSVEIKGTSSGVKDTSGNALASDYTWSFTTGSAQTTQYSLWPSTATPATVSVADGSAVELGVRFRSDTAGFITGLRFYKSAQNTGTHVGNLWSNTGALLGTVTFTNETGSGWQEASFSSPIPIVANTTYVASYHTTVGYYSATGAYFASSGLDNAPLHALANGVDGGNGVYQYGSSAFPNQSYNSTNYWVDVVFKP